MEEPLEYVRVPDDEEPERLPLEGSDGTKIGPEEACVRGDVDAPVRFCGVEATGAAGISSGLPHCRQTLPPSATSLIVLQFLQVTKYGTGAFGVDGIAGGFMPVVFRGAGPPQPGSRIAPTNSSGTNLDFFIAAYAVLLLIKTLLTLRCFCARRNYNTVPFLQRASDSVVRPFMSEAEP